MAGWDFEHRVSWHLRLWRRRRARRALNHGLVATRSRLLAGLHGATMRRRSWQGVKRVRMAIPSASLLFSELVHFLVSARTGCTGRGRAR